jgi:hypothetical protein
MRYGPSPVEPQLSRRTNAAYCLSCAEVVIITDEFGPRSTEVFEARAALAAVDECSMLGVVLTVRPVRAEQCLVGGGTGRRGE